MNSYRYLAILLKDELISFYKFCKESKVLILFVVLIVLLGFSNFIFNDHVYFANDKSNNVWLTYSSRAQELLEENGVKASLIDTMGAEDSVNQIDNANSKMNAAFTYGAALTEQQVKGIYSLGSIDYEPLWIFYNKKLSSKIKSFKDLAQYRVGCGPVESGTFKISEKLFKAHGIEVEQYPNIKTGLFDKQIEQLISGELDVLIRITAFDNQMIVSLLKNPDIELFSLDYAKAYEKNMNYLTAFDIPAGSLNLLEQIPKKDTRVVATTTSLVVRKDMNPSLQLILLMVAKEGIFQSNRLFFAKRNEFPAYMDHLIPISPVAKKYYDYGPPPVSQFFSYRVAAFLARLWPAILVFLAILYPLSKISLRFRRLHTSVQNYPFYEALLKIETAITKGGLSAEQKEALHKELDDLQKSVAKYKVNTGYEDQHFELLDAMVIIRARIDEA